MMATEKFEKFKELASQYNVIPVVKDILGDYETPISVAAKLESFGKYFLLESVEGGEKWGRYSILGMNIKKEFLIESGQAILREEDKEHLFPENPMVALQQYLRSFKVAPSPGLPRFFGGAVGYLAFETVRFFERCGNTKTGSDVFPDAYFMITDHLAVFDNINKIIKVIFCVHISEYSSLNVAFRKAQKEVNQIARILQRLRLSGVKSGSDKTNGEVTLKWKSNIPQKHYEKMVQKAKSYIYDGDIIQVVLAQHFKTKITAGHLDVYRALRFINPSPYLFYLKLDENRAIAGSSPEVMVRVTNDSAEIRPIAGTRPRGKDDNEDSQFGEDLRHDAKELAEHVMLVDLARNDLGRIAKIGSVQVTKNMIIEKYSHVMHLVSQVEAQIRDEFDAIDVLKASFPAGTLSGAPKVRAMEIISELEDAGRGPYGGALGYIAYGGKVMDMAITIRTVVLRNNIATVTAGAGIVYDSIPANEYKETLHKSNGMRKALEMAENGLRIK